MTQLSPRARSLLAGYKAAEALPSANKQRLLENLERAIHDGIAPRFDVSVQAPAALPPSMARRVWSSPLGRTIVVSAFFALPALAAFEIATHRAPAELPAAPPPRTVASPSPSSSPSAVVTGEATKVDVPLAAPAEAASAGKASGRAPLRTTPTGARAPNAESTIDAEMRSLTEAQAANQAGDPRRALELLDQFAVRFPASRLSDVQAVARMVALCKVGQKDQARREAARFLTKYPGSPFQDRVRGICASKGNP